MRWIQETVRKSDEKQKDERIKTLKKHQLNCKNASRIYKTSWQWGKRNRNQIWLENYQKHVLMHTAEGRRHSEWSQNTQRFLGKSSSRYQKIVWGITERNEDVDGLSKRV